MTWISKESKKRKRKKHAQGEHAEWAKSPSEEKLERHDHRHPSQFKERNA